MTPEQQAQYRQYVISQGLTPEQADQYMAYANTQASESAPVEQVQSPMVSTADRALIKNLSNSPEVGAKYLRQKNPNADVRVVNGEIQIKAKGDQAWNVVDPDTGIFSTDILNDAGDVAFDAGAGLLQGLATAKGAAIGAIGGLGVGAVPGAIAGSAVSGSALEAARQKLGAELGLPQEVNMTDVLASGAAGGVSAGLFGGGQAKGAVQKLYEMGKEKVLPKIGQLMSGVPSDAISHYANNMQRIDDLSDTGITNMVQDVTDRAQKAASGFKSKAGKAVGEAIRSADEQVDITPAKESFLKRIQQLKSKPDLTNADIAEINSLEKAFAQQFTGPGVGPTLSGQGQVMSQIPDKVDAERAFDLQQRLKQLAAFEQGMTPETAAMKSSARGAYGAINQGLDDVTGKVSSQAKANYRQALDAEEFIDKNFADPERTYRTLTGLDKKGRKLVAERLQKYSEDGLLDIGNEAKDIKAFNFFADPAMTPVGYQGATSTSRTIPLATAGGALGYYAGEKSGVPGGGFIGGGAGALLGSKAGSAAVIKNLIKAGVKADDAIGMINQATGSVMTPASSWMMMEKYRSAREP